MDRGPLNYDRQGIGVAMGEKEGTTPSREEKTPA